MFSTIVVDKIKNAQGQILYGDVSYFRYQLVSDSAQVSHKMEVLDLNLGG